MFAAPFAHDTPIRPAYQCGSRCWKYTWKCQMTKWLKIAYPPDAYPNALWVSVRGKIMGGEGALDTLPGL